MSAVSCPACEGFGWIPEDEGPGWYQRSWRTMLDPWTRWQRCPQCSRARDPKGRLQEELARHLVSRLEHEGRGWHEVDGWLRGDVQGQRVLRWRDLALLPPGPLAGPAWMLVSRLGIQRDLARSTVERWLLELDAPDIPSE